jgi:hypothetical protein
VGALDQGAGAPDRSGQLLFILIPSAWLAVVAFSIAMCRAAARGDADRVAGRVRAQVRGRTRQLPNQLPKDSKQGVRRPATPVGGYGP